MSEYMFLESMIDKVKNDKSKDGKYITFEMINELNEVYHKAKEWEMLKEKITKAISEIKSSTDQDVMSAVSSGVLSGILNYIDTAEEEIKKM